MPEPIARGRRYHPGIDGLRALAVSAVLAYHLGFGWAGGGLLGVGVFFTLSGYLITDLLLGQLATGELLLKRFWAARSRRLLPGLLVMLLIVTVWIAVSGRAEPGYTWNLVSSVFYVSNWQLIFQHVSYFARFGPPSPLSHLWSLGIEEQFYLLWPLLLLLGVRLVPERSRPARGRLKPTVRPRLAALTLLLAAASAIEMALLYKPGFDTSRLYFGTDTRAFELLVGAALAMVWPSRMLRANVAAGARRACDTMGFVGLVGIALLVFLTNQYSPFLYQGGFVLLSIATALLVAALVHPGARIGGLLGIAPLRWLGVRSYGIYLWHMPILALTTPARQHGVELPRAALQVAATVVLAALSWRFIEEPIRHGALTTVWQRWRSGVRNPRRKQPWRRVILVVQLVVVGSAVSVIGVLTAASSGGHSSTLGATARTTTTTNTLTDIYGTPETTTTTPPPTKAPGKASPLRSSCHAVVDIGDSTSEGLTSTSYLPNAKQRIQARYDKVGATVQHYEISGARSVVETHDGEPNAAEVAGNWVRKGYNGCWVLALGTNDTANIYVGGHVSLESRIEQMMAIIGNRPVMWVNTKSLLPSTAYSEHNMEAWNAALLEVCPMYKNMRVFDWNAVAKDSWFIDDGIHYTTPGYAERAQLIAKALARAFPATGHSTGCVVR